MSTDNKIRRRDLVQIFGDEVCIDYDHGEITIEGVGKITLPMLIDLQSAVGEGTQFEVIGNYDGGIDIYIRAPGDRLDDKR